MKQFIKHLVLFISILTLSFGTHFFLEEKGSSEIGPLTIKYVRNYGFIFGSFSGASSYLRVVFMSVLMGIILLISSFFYTYLARELKFLRYGMTTMLAGVVGNTLEKLYYGYAIDFISLRVSFLANYFFNWNDVFQIIGLSIIVFEIFSKQEMIWTNATSEKRKKLIIYPNIQLPIAVKIMGIIFLGSFTQGILTIALLFPNLGPETKDLQLIYIISLLALNGVLLPILGYFILHELLRCMGPIFALEKYFKAEKLSLEPLKLRKTDYFKSLEDSFNDFLKRVISSLREKP